MPCVLLLAWPPTALDEALRAPVDAELVRRRQVAQKRGGGDGGRARGVAEPADAHAVRPVAVERGDRALALRERVRSLPEAGAAPRSADLGAGVAQHLRDARAAQARVGPLDVALHRARAREDDELLRRPLRAFVARRLEDERGLEEVLVPAVRARADECLVEGDPFARDLGRGERVRRAEGLRDERHDLAQVERLVDLVARLGARREARIGHLAQPLRAVPGVRDVVRREDAALRFTLGHHVRDRVAVADRQLLPLVDEFHAHAARLRGAPAREEREHDVLAAHPGLELPGEYDAALPGDREVHVAGRPAEAERRRAHTDADRTVRAVRPAVRVRAGDERARRDETLLREIEVEDAVARRRVVRPAHPVEVRELLADRGLLVGVLLLVEHEVVVRDRGLSRIDRVAAGDLVERVDGERRGPVGRGEQVRVHAQRRAGPHVGAFVDAVRPEDLFRRGQAARGPLVGPGDPRCGAHGARELAPTDRDDPARAADLLLLRRERRGRVGLAARLVGERPRRGVEAERVALLRVFDGRAALKHGQAEVECVTAEDVAHGRPADDDDLVAGLLADALQPRGAHLAGAADREAGARDDEILSPRDALTEVGHEIPERARLPALVKAFEALGDAVGGWGDLVGVDRVELAARDLRIPEDERLAADNAVRGAWSFRRGAGRECIDRRVRSDTRRLDGLHATLHARTGRRFGSGDGKGGRGGRAAARGVATRARVARPQPFGLRRPHARERAGPPSGWPGIGPRVLGRRGRPRHCRRRDLPRAPRPLARSHRATWPRQGLRDRRADNPRPARGGRGARARERHWPAHRGVPRAALPRVARAPPRVRRAGDAARRRRGRAGDAPAAA